MRLLTLLLLSQIASAVSFQDMQWGLKNNGQSYERSSGDYRFETIVGKPGIDINFSEDNIKTGKQTIVAIIDTGVDILHPELAGRIWENPKCVANPNRVDCHGINVLDRNNNLTDEAGHGTFVAGLIAARRDNDGVDGLTAGNVKIMPIKAVEKSFNGFFYNGKLTSELLADAVVYAADNGAHVINMSLGYPKILITPRVKKAFKYALDKNIVLVAAAGNNNKARPVFPCNFSGVLCVGGHDSQGNRVESSNYGHKVDVYAPGEKIVSLSPLNVESKLLRVKGFDIKTGTSYAAPYVAALAANIISQEDNISNKEVVSKILSSVRVLDNGLKLVDFNQALKQEATQLELELKNIDEVTISSKGTFSVSIPYRGNLNDYELGAFSEFSEFIIESTEKNILLSGQINDLNLHSGQNIELLVTNKEKKVTLPYNLVIDFNMALPKAERRSIVQKVPAAAIMSISDNGKRSVLNNVIHYHADDLTRELFFTSKGNLSKVYVLQEKAQGLIPLVLKMNVPSIVEKVIKVDIDNDGKKDYFVYALDSKRKDYKFYFFDGNGEKLFANNMWSISSSLFNGLSFTNKGPSFAFLKMSTGEFAGVNVPAYVKTGSMPFEDNGNDPIDRLTIQDKRRLFYLMPKLVGNKVELSQRTLENVDNIRKAYELIGLNAFDELDSLKLLTQNDRDIKDGILKLLVLAGEGNRKSAQILVFKNGLVSHVESPFYRRYSTSHNVFDFLNRSGQRDFLFTKVVKRNILSLAHEDNLKMIKTDWSDPFRSLIDASYEDGKITSFLATRYGLIYISVDKDGRLTQSSTPINRESSYSGAAFNQSFIGTKVSPDLNGVFTDTREVFGNTVGVYVPIDNKVVLPVKYNFSIADNCVSLGHIQKESKTFVQTHCMQGAKSWVERIELRP
jgi:cell wall-associated protease